MPGYALLLTTRGLFGRVRVWLGFMVHTRNMSVKQSNTSAAELQERQGRWKAAFLQDLYYLSSTVVIATATVQLDNTLQGRIHALLLQLSTMV